jgi:YesN/AraC family two-component response regulator
MTLQAQDNPYMQMTEKTFADYSPELLYEFNVHNNSDTVGCQKMILQAAEVARKTGSMEWKMLSDYLDLLLFERKMVLFTPELYWFDEFHRRMCELLDKTQKSKIQSIELLARWKIIEYYFYYVKNYESAFQECAIQAKLLQTVSSEAIPNKAHFYVQIADNFFFFKDYPTAIYYYKKILEENETIHSQLPQQNARNGLGLIYMEINQLDTAEIFLQAIKQVSYLNAKNDFYRDMIDAMADGNLGAVMLLREEYDRAIPLFESSLDKALKFYDPPFAACRAVDLANIYIRNNNLPEAKRYIDLAITNRSKTKTPRNNDVFYEVLHKYYAAIGDQQQSMAFMDIMLKEKKQSETKYNALILLRIEQKEAAVRQMAFEQETLKRQQAQRMIMVLALGLVIILGLSITLLMLYRRKRKAYRELVRKSQEWAQVSASTVDAGISTIHANTDESGQPDNQNELPGSADYIILEEIEKMMQEEKLYRDAALSIHSLSQKLGAKQYYVSNAINRCRNKSFNTYINEYRIKDAIRMMSSKDAANLSIDGIAVDSGFSDRRNFYKVFKKITGLSPTEFKRNII